MKQTITPLAILLRAFSGIPENEAQGLVDRGEMLVYPPNIVLCHEDAVESTFYIILEGKVKVTKVISTDQVRLLKILSAGDFFGEMGLIQNAPRAASVTTLEHTAVLEISKELFDELLHSSASISLAMAKEVSRRLRENDAMAIEDLRLKAGELATAYQQLAEQEYARREFLTRIAHELRTPLTAANGYLHMLLMGQLQGPGVNSEAQQAAVNNVSRNIQQIVSLVNDILFLQEMDLILPRFQPTDLEDVMNTVVENQLTKAGENRLSLKLEIDPQLPLISGDSKSLERAFSAILDNAIKFSPDGGDVYIRACRDNEQVRIEFQDQGVGIPPDILPRIFDRFFHLDQLGGRMFRGIGLGLSIARHVIEQHNGKINVESVMGKGTKITIHLDSTQNKS